MERKLYDSFGEYHPLVNFVYFTTVIIFSMVFQHPILLIISILSSFIYTVMLNGVKGLKFNLYFLLPIFFIVIILNPLFSHEGMTILFYLSNKPITLESFIYGIVTAMMLVTMVMWFSCYNKVITSEKMIYLFSKTIPSIGLLISMTLSFVPKFKIQLKKIRLSQRNIGRDINSGSLYERIKHGCMIVSILITWALENGVQTADSMRGRGYGLSGRTNFSLYKVDKRDKIALSIMVSLIIICILGYVGGKNAMQFYPYIKIGKIGFADYIIYLAYSILVFFPVIIERREELRWTILKSKI
ncbi:energy-coupling factor transporter transmembrane component T [Clostridium sp.]|uniref:energy-coupling factor transporter transmembrane component T n=1 Tax=Clostridium sp. TaxID=1506 RepID=UPI002630EE01|nr:energy-coupling factor transporter transmembrane component T [Clostridium sp.]